MSKPAEVVENIVKSTELARSRALHTRAMDVMPDGVAGYSQNRLPHPLYLSRGEGTRLFDVDGNEYIDYMLGAGPLILGHRHPAVVAAVEAALRQGVPNIGVCESQIELAELLQRHVPSMERVRFVPTGTEAVQAVIRVARQCTGRKLIAKFEGAYHGQAENVLVSVSALAERRGDVNAPNAVPYHCHLPEALASLTLILPFNEIDACTALIERHANDLAVVLVEPMLGFAGAIPADREFLTALRDVTERHGVLLAFDEVITGFRLAMGGAQELYGVTPDLTVLGKAIGGGMPLAAFGGREDIMSHLSVEQHPQDYVFQSGTFSAFPMSVAAGVATLRTMEQTNAIAHTNAIGDQMRGGLRRIVADCGLVADVTGIGSLFHIHFTAEPVRSARQAQDADQALITALHRRLLDHGIYFYCGRLGFLSAAHGEDEIGFTLGAIETVLREMKAQAS